ncbi:5'-methylthioadenosine/S-adenosylhomocysteine nucleosidase [mine drainage metagenome]|uniref:5'-methylthioadenosine/S-adenosylhomocysteine nucleosidase n=1 Tax=mine drainage metagenome TaxID=410659 RepID=A0A1J5T5I6_9ZZZZ
MAAPAEYGPHLAARIQPLMIGIGPVEAAVTLAADLAGRAARRALPDLVVSLGSAGSRRLPQTGIFQVSSLSYRDMDASVVGFEKGQTPLAAYPAVIDLPHRIPGLPAASLSTGGTLVSGQAYDTIDADMVDMESFAVWRACHQFGLPLIGLRGISDGATELTQVADWKQYLHIIDEKLAQALDLLDSALASGAVLQATSS